MEDDAASAAPFDVRRPSHCLMCFGSPLGASRLVQGPILIIFGFLTWAAVNKHDDADLIFEAQVVTEGPRPGPKGGFRFPGQASLDRPDSPRVGEAQESDLASLLKREDR